MEIKLLTSEELVKTAKGFIKYGDHGYFDSTKLLGGVQVHCGACMLMEIEGLTKQAFTTRVKTSQISVIYN